MQTVRLSFIDSLRGFAAAWVVIFHLNEVGQFSPSVYQWFVKHGQLGVPIFFVLSGYSIHRSLLRTESVRQFIWRRFWRIYPPYLASIFVVLITVISFKLINGVNGLITLPKSLWGWFATLTLTTTPVTSVPTINWVYWTLSYEIAFYLWMCLALLAPKLKSVVLVAPVILSLAWPDSAVFFVDQWCLFGFGIALAEWHHSRSRIGPVLLALCFADALLHRKVGEVTAASAALVLVAMSASRQFGWLNRERAFNWLGQSSYSLYLTHVPIGAWIALSVDRYPRPTSANSMPAHLLIDAFAMSLCIVFAYFFWRFIERPSLKMAHKI